MPTSYVYEVGSLVSPFNSLTYLVNVCLEFYYIVLVTLVWMKSVLIRDNLEVVHAQGNDCTDYLI